MTTGKSLLLAAIVAIAFSGVGCDEPATGPASGFVPEVATVAVPAQERLADERPAADLASPADAVAEQSAFLPPGPTEKDYPHLHNLLRVSDRIYSGAEPHDDDAFAELAKLGVKTVVSVDGARPDAEAARRHGLRYVHVPFGYDGIPADASAAIARVLRETAGPIYVHCHHGTHRGPAAAAIACIVQGVAGGDEALRVLHLAGTSEGYAGLWRDVKAFEPPGPDAKLPELVESADVGSMAAAMAKIDRAKDNLKLSEKADWRTPPSHPDLVAAQEALLLREGFREIVRRLEDDNPYDATFLAQMRAAEVEAGVLEAAVAKNDRVAASISFARTLQRCDACHVRDRN